MTVTMANFRQYSLFDKAINYLDSFRSEAKLSANQAATQHSLANYPAQSIVESPLTNEQRKQSIKYMRVNHSGEISAQYLYFGQEYFTSNLKLKAHFRQAAQEEHDHLNWCAYRLTELAGQPSIFNPIWRIGSFSIGAIAGLMGDKWSLGFLFETEMQVTAHLDKQINNLSPADLRSRAILEQMRADELQHANSALEHGGRKLPYIVKKLMAYSAKIMTTTSAII